MIIATFLSSLLSAQIHVSGDIQVVEISPLEYENAYNNKLKQPRYYRTGKTFFKLTKAYVHDFNDSITYYGVDTLNRVLRYQKINLHIEKGNHFLIHACFPIQDYSYLYNCKYECKGHAMWGGGIVDGCLYAAERGFDCDEYVHIRFYNLYQTTNYAAEIKEKSFNYFIPHFDDRESFFFDKSHDFYFTIMKKWDGPSKYYRVITQRLRNSDNFQ